MGGGTGGGAVGSVTDADVSSSGKPGLGGTRPDGKLELVAGGKAGTGCAPLREGFTILLPLLTWPTVGLNGGRFGGVRSKGWALSDWTGSSICGVVPLTACWTASRAAFRCPSVG